MCSFVCVYIYIWVDLKMAYDVAVHGCIHVYPRYGTLAVAVSKTVSVYLENTWTYLSNPKHTISGWKMQFHTKSCCFISTKPLTHFITVEGTWCKAYHVQLVASHIASASHLKNNFSLSALFSYNSIPNNLKEHAFKNKMNETQWHKYPFGWDLPHIYSILEGKGLRPLLRFQSAVGHPTKRNIVFQRESGIENRHVTVPVRWSCAFVLLSPDMSW